MRIRTRSRDWGVIGIVYAPVSSGVSLALTWSGWVSVVCAPLFSADHPSARVMSMSPRPSGGRGRRHGWNSRTSRLLWPLRSPTFEGRSVKCIHPFSPAMGSALPSMNSCSGTPAHSAVGRRGPSFAIGGIGVGSPRGGPATQPTKTDSMRVVLADDSTLLREGLEPLLERAGHDVVVTDGRSGPGERSGHVTVALIHRNRADH